MFGRSNTSEPFSPTVQSLLIGLCFFGFLLIAATCFAGPRRSAACSGNSCNLSVASPQHFPPSHFTPPSRSAPLLNSPPPHSISGPKWPYKIGDVIAINSTTRLVYTGNPQTYEWERQVFTNGVWVSVRSPQQVYQPDRRVQSKLLRSALLPKRSGRLNPFRIFRGNCS